MRFTQGVSGNPKGRPTGTTKNSKKKNINHTEYNTALTKLLEALKKGESWACEIFFENLAPKLEQEVLQLEVDQCHTDRIEALIIAVIKTLSSLKTISFSDSCKLLDTLSRLKFIDGIFKQQDYLRQLLTDEQYKTLRTWLAESEVQKLN